MLSMDGGYTTTQMRALGGSQKLLQLIRLKRSRGKGIETKGMIELRDQMMEVEEPAGQALSFIVPLLQGVCGILDHSVGDPEVRGKEILEN